MRKKRYGVQQSAEADEAGLRMGPRSLAQCWADQMEGNVRVETLDPAGCTGEQITAFCTLVRLGCEVASAGLGDRVRQAVRLVFLYDEGKLAGVAAIKRPHHSYRQRVFKSAAVELARGSYSLELGWVFVDENHRRRGHSTRLVEAAMASVSVADVFATSRSNNVAMHKSLERHGFKRSGNDYPSTRKKGTLRLFTGRPPNNEYLGSSGQVSRSRSRR